MCGVQRFGSLAVTTFTLFPLFLVTGIPPAMMKLMYKGTHTAHVRMHTYTHHSYYLTTHPPPGLVKDDKTVRDLKVVPGAKMMVVGSTIHDVITVQPPSADELKQLQTDTTGTYKFTTM